MKISPIIKSTCQGVGKVGKWIAIVIAIVLAVGLLEHLFFNNYSEIQAFRQSLRYLKTHFLVFHAIVIALIVWIWPFYMKALMSKAQKDERSSLSAEEMENRQWLKSRWLILALLLSIELMLNLNSIINLF